MAKYKMAKRSCLVDDLKIAQDHNVKDKLLVSTRGKKKETISSKEVVFTNVDESPSETVLEITSDSESEYDNQEPLPPLYKLSRAM
ncbi:hypothetical protein Tco_0156550 [Tanacetum coccineum]